MTPAERATKITELRAEADRLEREGKRNWPETVEIGMIFQHDDGEVYIASRAAEDALTRYQSPDCLVCVSGAYPGFGVMYAEPSNCSPFDGDESDFTYLGHARDLLTIKTPDAPEPTGAELVGKVCVFCDSNFDTFSTSQSECRGFGLRGYQDQRGVWWRSARLHKEQK